MVGVLVQAGELGNDDVREELPRLLLGGDCLR